MFDMNVAQSRFGVSLFISLILSACLGLFGMHSFAYAVDDGESFAGSTDMRVMRPVSSAPKDKNVTQVVSLVDSSSFSPMPKTGDKAYSFMFLIAFGVWLFIVGVMFVSVSRCTSPRRI